NEHAYALLRIDLPGSDIRASSPRFGLLASGHALGGEMGLQHALDVEVERPLLGARQAFEGRLEAGPDAQADGCRAGLAIVLGGPARHEEYGLSLGDRHRWMSEDVSQPYASYGLRPQCQGSHRRAGSVGMGARMPTNARRAATARCGHARCRVHAAGD